jgi:hypothetical protein
MPCRDYRCPAGHENEEFFHPASHYPDTIRCPDCGRDATYVKRLGCFFQPVIHAHFNQSFGRVVTGRTQLRAEQREHNTEDYDRSYDFAKAHANNMRAIQDEGQRKIDEMLRDISVTVPRTSKPRPYRAPNPRPESAVADLAARELSRLESE